jgi:hypothetical protein
MIFNFIHATTVYGAVIKATKKGFSTMLAFDSTNNVYHPVVFGDNDAGILMMDTTYKSPEDFEEWLKSKQEDGTLEYIDRSVDTGFSMITTDDIQPTSEAEDSVNVQAEDVPTAVSEEDLEEEPAEESIDEVAEEPVEETSEEITDSVK